jgi:FkbM family methyltransferase
MRRPVKKESLDKLIAMGAPVGSVIDVGVLTCTGPLLSAFPKCKHLLIEPIVEWNEAIAKNYKTRGVPYELVNVAASDRNGTVTMKTASVRPGQPITHARMFDGAATADDETLREVPMATVDSLIAERTLEPPYLLKIDVDGAEPAILKGAKETLKKTSIVVIEAGMQTLIERATMLREAGFLLFDVVDLCYYDDRLAQVDLVFLSFATIQEHKLQMYKEAFDIEKWKELA